MASTSKPSISPSASEQGSNQPTALDTIPHLAALSTRDSADNEDEEVSPELKKLERALVRRLDLCMLTVGFVSYVTKYLDQTNINNAYVSGMKEDLQLNGNQLNYFSTYFNIGYVLMLFPSQVIISHIGPSKWLPSLELTWGALTCCVAAVTNYKQVYGLRALIGFCEGSAWPAYFALISSWYHPSEIGLRLAIYNAAQPVGAMLSGALQGALSTNLDGVGGRSGWRWAFIINGAFTMAVALIAYFFLPGYPERPNPLAKFWLSSTHVQVAINRNRRIRRLAQRPITAKSFLACFMRWEIWVFTIAWLFGVNTAISNYFNLYLKSLKNSNGAPRFTVAQLNYYPIGGQALNLVCELVFSGLSDYYQSRLIPLLVHAAINISSQVILLKAPASNVPLHITGYLMNGTGALATLVICAWASDTMNHLPEARSIFFATAPALGYIIAATLPLAAFPASEAPNWRIGTKPYLVFMCIATCLFVAIWFITKRRMGLSKPQSVEEEKVTGESGREKSASLVDGVGKDEGC